MPSSSAHGSPMHVCPVRDCTGAFSRKRDLTRHQQTHSDTKQHICTMCNFSSHQLGGLKTHMNVHKEKKETCDICNEPCSDLSALSKHRLRKCVGGYRCPAAKCNSIVSSEGSALLHRKRCSKLDPLIRLSTKIEFSLPRPLKPNSKPRRSNARPSGTRSSTRMAPKTGPSSQSPSSTAFSTPVTPSFTESSLPFSPSISTPTSTSSTSHRALETEFGQTEASASNYSPHTPSEYQVGIPAFAQYASGPGDPGYVSDFCPDITPYMDDEMRGCVPPFNSFRYDVPNNMTTSQSFDTSTLGSHSSLEGALGNSLGLCNAYEPVWE